MLKLPFTKTMGDVHAFGLLSPSFLSVNSNSYNAQESSLSSTSYGLSFSYSLDDLIWNTLEKKKKKKISLYVKGGLIKDNFDYELNIPTFNETYSDIDIDGGNYDRTVLLENFTENQINAPTFVGNLTGTASTASFAAATFIDETALSYMRSRPRS